MGREDFWGEQKAFSSKAHSDLMAWSISVHKGICLTQWCLFSHAGMCSGPQASVSFCTSLHRTASSRRYSNVYLQDNRGINTVPNNMPESGLSSSDVALTWA